MTECRWCQAETSNGLTLCERCRQTLSTSCVNTAAYFTDVDNIRPGERVKVRSAYKSTPPPSNEPAADPIGETLDLVATLVFGWCRALADDRPTAEIPGTTERRLGWLESYVVSIATLDWAAECLREMLDCERKLKRVLDKADTGQYAGICGNEMGRETIDGEVFPVQCARHLYVPAGASWVRCPECGRTWDADERRAQMLRLAEDRLAPIRVIARVVVELTAESSVERLTRRIEQWVHREQLVDYGVRVLAGKPRRVYRIGDVLRLAKVEAPPVTEEAC